MTIKYANVIINRDLEQESWVNYFKRWVGEENIVNENDTIIILFEDGSICDVKAEHVDKQFEMGQSGFRSIFPFYFNKKGEKTLFLKTPKLKECGLTLDFKPIFKDNKDYGSLHKVPSSLNAIYHSINSSEMFAIIKYGTNDNSPRYLIAYDDEYFERPDIIYFVNYIFNIPK